MEGVIVKDLERQKERMKEGEREREGEEGQSE